MKLDFDISTVEHKIIHEILTQYLNDDYKIWVFGSRVKNQVKYNSDLDLAIEYKNKIDIKLLRKIKRALEESKLPFKVDILDLNAGNEEFNALIKKDMIPFPLKFLDKVPKLRFKEFSGEWEEKRVDYLLEQYSNPVDVIATQSYRQIGTRSHGKGVFHKENVTGKELGNKRVFWVHENALVINIIFAWEHSIALTSEREKGFIASHRFPMYLPKENRCNLNFIVEFFLRKYGKYLLELASPGGAGRNKTLGKSNFNELKLIVPSVEEQDRIVEFLSIVDRKIKKLREQVSLLEDYKKGMMQKIFSQEIRFKNDDGDKFEDWEEEKLGDVLDYEQPTKYQVKNTEYNNLYQIPVLTAGKKFILGYTNEERGIYTEFPVIIFDDFTTANHYVNFAFKVKSSAMKILKVKNETLNLKFIYEYIQIINFPVSEHKRYWISEYSNLKIYLPQLSEQIKIANFLTKIDQRIEASKKQLEESNQYKKALLQQMFI